MESLFIWLLLTSTRMSLATANASIDEGDLDLPQITTRRKIFQNRNLTFLWLGQMFSQSGDSIYQIGLLWLVLELSGSESITGLVAMSSYLPAVLFALFAGVAADRLDRRRIMLSADASRTLLILLVPAAYILGFLSPLFLAINAFAIAITATFFNPARDSLVPQIVPQSGLLRANSLIQTSWQFSLLLGPAIAGFLLHVAGKIHLFTFDSIAYFASFFCVLLIRPPQRKLRPSKRDLGVREILEGLEYAVKQPVILPLLLITIADNIFIMGPAIVGTPVFVKQELGLGAEAYALIQACYAVGMLLGTAGLFTIGTRFKKGQLLLTGMVLDGLTFIPLFFVNNIVAMAIIIVIHSIAIPLLTISRTSLIQDIVPTQMTGRIFALVNLAVVGMSALSSGITGFALEAVGARMVFLIIGIGGGFCGFVGWVFARQLSTKS
jgi:DHA3 family macrolide efflux protein-like MFS transporter